MMVALGQDKVKIKVKLNARNVWLYGKPVKIFIMVWFIELIHDEQCIIER